MKLPVTLRRRAEADLDDAFAWYEAVQGGLGTAFALAAAECIERVRDHPEAFPLDRANTRRATLHRFPYHLFYVVRSDRILVIAIYHARRRPRRFTT